MERCKLGHRLADKKHAAAVSEMESFINCSIKQMLEESKAGTLIKEDLTFTKNTISRGPRMNRKLSSWAKGYLDERIEYRAASARIETKDINPAYTSQYCSCCGAKVTRKGKHREIAVCPECGEMNANTNAAHNIVARENDTEITLYTPYKVVGKILDERYQKKIQLKIPA